MNTPPIAKADHKRVDHQRLVWRIMYGQHRRDIDARIRLSAGNIRGEAWGPTDLTSNPLLSIWSQGAATYRSAPAVEGPPEVLAAVADSGHWSKMQRVQRDSLALREMLVRIDYDEAEGLSTRPVAPFLCEVIANKRHPHKADQVTEWMPDPEDEDEWIAVTCNPKRLLYEARDKDGNDVSARILGGVFNGEAYPFRRPDGTPLLPWVVYRPGLTGSFWDWSTGKEMVEAVLNLGVLYTFLLHLARDCSWPQRWVLGAVPAGEVDSETGEATEIVTDPSTAIILRAASEFIGQPQIGQWGAASDPEAMLRMIQSYERRIVDNALGTANVSRASSDIRSGFSLAVSKEDQRELQRSYEPEYRRVDLELLDIAGALMGIQGEYRIEYKAIPKDPREVAADLDRITKAIEAGLMTTEAAYMELHPSLTAEQAAAEVAEIARLNSEMRSPAPSSGETTDE